MLKQMYVIIVNVVFEERIKLYHDHITGEYISTLCNDYNLQFKYKPFLPVHIYNLKSYDALTK